MRLPPTNRVLVADCCLGHPWLRLLYLFEPQSPIGAFHPARVDVAEARMQGDIDEAENKGGTKQEVSKTDA